MTARDYLSQAWYLDKKIRSDLQELEDLREMAGSVSSPGFGERVQTSAKHEAPFVGCIEKIMEMEKSIDAEVKAFMELKKEIRSVIDALESADEKLVLKYRYIHNMTWEQIGEELMIDPRTVRRRHSAALGHVVLPKRVRSA